MEEKTMKLSKKAKKHVETANKAFEGTKASMKGS